MSNRAARPTYSEDYFRLESETDRRLEYWDGEILDMMLVIEVLSPSTELYDRKRKSEGYRAIDTV